VREMRAREYLGFRVVTEFRAKVKLKVEESVKMLLFVVKATKEGGLFGHLNKRLWCGTKILTWGPL